MEIIEVIKESGVEKSTAEMLEKSFSQFFTQAKEWESKAKALIVTDVSQKKEMAEARKARLALKDIRVAADKKRKELKEDSLRYGKAVQGVYNVIEYLIVPIEKHLQEQEEFEKRIEEKRINDLRIERQTEIAQYAEFVPMNLDFGTMADEDYDKLLTSAKFQFQAKIEAGKKAEAERLEKQRLDALEQNRRMRIAPYVQFNTGEHELRTMTDDVFEKLMQSLEKAKADYDAEQEKIRLENERLRKEKEAAEIAARIERERLEAERKKADEEAKAKLEAERKERERVENELRVKREKEEAELKAKQEAERKAKAAPDKEKLLVLAQLIDEIKLPEVKTEEAQAIINSSRELLVKVSNYIREKSNKL